MNGRAVKQAGAAVRHLAASGLVPWSPLVQLRLAGAARGQGNCLAALAALAAARAPERAAVADDEGALTYAELAQRSDNLAARLGDAGVGPGTTVALIARNHRWFIVSLLAASRTGADIVLVNAEMSSSQLQQVMQRHRPAAIIHDACISLDPSSAEGTTVITTRQVESLSDPAPALRRLPPVRRAGKIILMTSGTTGTAKSAPRSLSPSAVLGLAVSGVNTMKLREGESVYAAPPFFHGFGLLAVVTALGVAGTVVTRQKFDAQHLAEAVAAGDVSVIIAVPTMLVRLVALPPAPGKHQPRLILTGASAVPTDLVNRVLERYGPCLVVGYGSTEAGVATLASPKDLARDASTVGDAVLGCRIRVLRDDRSEAAPGETGTIFVRGAMRYDGYSGEDAAREKEIIGGFLNTGDLGFLDEADQLHVVGREDDMIVAGGENIFATEVEEVLRRHPDVLDAAVLGVDDPAFGQRLRAYLVLRDGSPEPDMPSLKTHVRSHLERYKSPREAVFVDELPLNATGKLQRFRLADLPAERFAYDPERTTR